MFRFMYEHMKVGWNAVCAAGAGVRDALLETVLEFDMERNSEAVLICFPRVYADWITLNQSGCMLGRTPNKVHLSASPFSGY